MIITLEVDESGKIHIEVNETHEDEKIRLVDMVGALETAKLRLYEIKEERTGDDETND